jgi:hypothetical protein
MEGIARQKKAELPYKIGNPAVLQDPWLSVPALRQLWLYLKLFYHFLKMKVKNKNWPELRGHNKMALV